MLNSFSNSRKGKQGFFLLLAILASTTTALARQDPLRVGFICQSPPDNPFWNQVVTVMQAVADDLDIDLVIKYAHTTNSYTFKRLGNRLLDSDPKLDYLLTKYLASITAEHIQHAAKRGTRVFVFNADIPQSDYELVGRRPRETYSNWIGHMLPNDRQAGYDLATALINRARQIGDTGKEGKIDMLAVDSHFESTVGTNRLEGLNEKAAEASDVVLKHVETAGWEVDALYEEMVKTLRQNNYTNVFWSPDEAMAWAAVQAAEHIGKTPGKDVLIGGFDWNTKSIEAIADGRITASMFGHFLEGAWALILVHDYHYGFDFADDPGVRISTPLSIINQDNYQQYKALFVKDYWDKIDFRKYSKKYNPELKSYNFSISQFLE